ncbi:hypothetical protein NBRC111894_1685 [Sporolactobacillus inulinus]|uniref:Chromosome partition protein smc n=1 Tax=Sporolactobacillus inulinus TaxID=2078 RepID=A0A4Y1ZB38_9BACL|nr:hypothetical protein [Sporolactobacillus inulinus]GAY76131.1 hypothetical protein NBRC111894_1685 [Sporolactobacillus inulinus]
MQIKDSDFHQLFELVTDTRKVILNFKDSVDKRFEAVDERFDQVDKHFDTVDRRLSNLETAQLETNARLSKLEAGQHKTTQALTAIADVLREHAK